MESSLPPGVVISSTPGRLRVRLPRAHPQHAQVLHDVHTRLQQQPGVDRVSTIRTTRSVTVKYNPRQVSHLDVVALLRDCGVIAEETLTALGEEVPELPGDKSATAVSLGSALDDLNRQVLAATGRKVDLKLLFPLGLGALGLRQVLVEGFGFSQVPGYLLLWLAFDAFWKFHHARPSQTEVSSAGQGRIRRSSQPGIDGDGEHPTQTAPEASC